MRKVILGIFDVFCLDFRRNTQQNLQNFKKPLFSVELQTKAKQRLRLALLLTKRSRKILEGFLVE